jgi:NADH dehydrogenase
MVSLNELPGVAQPAMQEGKYVGKVIKARLAGDETSTPYEYFVTGTMATIGHRGAVAYGFGMKFTGWLGYTMWGFIHVLYLIGWGNRLGTLYTWSRALTFSNNRGHRIITFEQAHEHALESEPAQEPAPEPAGPPGDRDGALPVGPGRREPG